MREREGERGREREERGYLGKAVILSGMVSVDFNASYSCFRL